MSCIVPGCSSNYRGEEHFTTVFSFPNDYEFREKWFRAIPRPREDYQNNKNIKVCILHFKEEFIERTFKYFDGQIMAAKPRDRLSLTKIAVPTIFPNCPSYLTNTTEDTKRISRDDRELTMVQTAINLSIVDNKSTMDKFSITILNDIDAKLSCIELSNSWVVHKPDIDTLFFLKIISLDNQPSIQCSLVIDKCLLINGFDQHKRQIDLSLNKINDIRQIETLLVEIETFSVNNPQSKPNQHQPSVIKHVENAIIELQSANKLIEHSDQDIEFVDPQNENLPKIILQKIGIMFLLDQLRYLIISKNGRRYSVTTQVFSLKVHGISPACYRLIQSSNCLNLPHERNLLKIKNSIGLESEYISVLKEFSSTFKDLERHVILQMDEVHIRSDASYKGGRIIGSIDHPEDPPTTVFSIMVSSLMTKFSTIVRLIPLGSSSAAALLHIVIKTISDIESCNLYVDAVCTDNYPLNVSLYKLLSPNQKTLLPEVIHPCDPNRDLILFFDIVHILKSIRNNWLNLKDYEKVFIFPKFNDCIIPDKTSVEDESQGHLRVSINTSGLNIDTVSFARSLYPTICYSVFEDIRTLYKSDRCNIFKRAPKLTSKACWPSSLERQNVNLALKIFHESTSAGLLALNIERKSISKNQTVDFLKLINNIWKMFNVNWVGKGIRYNDDFSRPLSPNDSRILFLRNVVNWLDCWKNLPTVQGKLSPQTFASLKHTCNALPLLVDLLCTKYGFLYLLTSRIQNDPLEHHFGLYRQMSGSHYQISYGQILESERRLQLSSILKLFDIKTKSDTIHKPTLMEYLNTFSSVTDNGADSNFELEKLITNLEQVTLPEMAISQVECLAFVAGYAVFSYLNKSNGCPMCRDVLTTEKSIQVNDDIGNQFRLIELLDRGSLKYPSTCVIDITKIIYDIFCKIDSQKQLFENFYTGSSRTKLVRLACIRTETKYGNIWRVWCDCSMSRWDILQKLFVTLSNCLFSNKVKTYNSMVLGRDNYKLKKFKN